MKKKTDIILLLPSLAGFLAFYVIPFFWSLYYAFTGSAFKGSGFVGLENFKRLFSNEFFQLAMVNTGKFTIIAVPLTMAVSLIIAFILARFGGRLPFVRSALFLPVILPSATVVMLWNAYISDFTPFSSLLLIFLWKYSGLNIMLMLTALSGIDKNMIEASQIDGANNMQRLFRVILPNIVPTLFFTLILSLVNSLKIFRESYLLYGGYPDESVYMLQNFLNNHFVKLNYQYISTAAIVFAVIVYTAAAIIFIAEKKWSDAIW